MVPRWRLTRCEIAIVVASRTTGAMVDRLKMNEFLDVLESSATQPRTETPFPLRSRSPISLEAPIMRRTIRTLLASALLVMCLPLAMTAADKDDEMVDNPMYTAWASFKPGATATHLEKTTYSGEKTPVPDEKVITYTLVSVSADKVVVRTVVVEREVFGTVESSPAKHTYPAKLKKSYVAEAVP